MVDKLLTVSEVAHQLGVSEGDVAQLVARGELKAIRLGGEVLRFHPQDVATYQVGHQSPVTSHQLERSSHPARPAWAERVRDFLYTYDFYVAVAVALLLILAAILAMAS